MWLINTVVFAGVMARIFVFGEPVTTAKSEGSVHYWRYRKQADIDLARVGVICQSKDGHPYRYFCIANCNYILGDMFMLV